MRRTSVATLVFLLGLSNLSAQQLSPEDHKLLEAARSRYYSLTDRGLVSFTCAVHFDVATVPDSLLPSIAVEERKLLSATSFTISLGQRTQPSVTVVYPSASSPETQQSVKPASEWIRSLVSGFFMTWPSQGLGGPFPPFEGWVGKITGDAMGYRIDARSANGLESIALDKDFKVKRVISVAGRVVEEPSYTATSDGLVFSGMHAIDSEPGGRTDVRYQIESAPVDGFLLPRAVHMQVNDNVDVRFTLSDCSVVKGKVIQLKP